MIASSRRRALALLALALSLSGCGGAEEAPPPVTPSAKKKAAAEAAPAPVVATVSYSYDPVNKRDPFRNMSVEGPRGVPDRDEPECDEPMCRIDLDDLRCVAVISGDANPLAMVQDPSSVGYIVRRNTRMGRQGGKVTQIRRDCIVVTSFTTEGADGKRQANKQELCCGGSPDDRRTAAPMDLLKNREFIP